MNKRIEEFLKEVIESKEKQLLSIALDLNYWKDSIKGKSEDDLRAQLEEQNGLRIITKTGKVIKDERDMEKIGVLSKDIELVTKATTEIVRLEDMEKSILNYVTFVTNPSEETIKKFEEILA